MRRESKSLNQTILENVAWFSGSLVLAFLIWLLALTQVDPLVQRRIRNIPVRLTPDENLMIINGDSITDSATIVARVPESLQSLLLADDILVFADLEGLPPGEHVVELQWQIVEERRAFVEDISPVQISVELEEVGERLIDVRTQVTGTIPDNMVLALSDSDLLITGPRSAVEQVSEAIVPVDLRGQGASFADSIRPLPVDAEGNAVDGLTLTPQFITVSLDEDIGGEDPDT